MTLLILVQCLLIPTGGINDMVTHILGILQYYIGHSHISTSRYHNIILFRFVESIM